MAVVSSKDFCFVCVFDRPVKSGAVDRVIDTTTWIVEVTNRDESGVVCREGTMSAAAIAEICKRVHAVDGWRFISAVRVKALCGTKESHCSAFVDMSKVNI